MCLSSISLAWDFWSPNYKPLTESLFFFFFFFISKTNQLHEFLSLVDVVIDTIWSPSVPLKAPIFHADFTYQEKGSFAWRWFQQQEDPTCWIGLLLEKPSQPRKQRGLKEKLVRVNRRATGKRRRSKPRDTHSLQANLGKTHMHQWMLMFPSIQRKPNSPFFAIYKGCMHKLVPLILS